METEAPRVAGEPGGNASSPPGEVEVPAIRLRNVTKLFDARPAVEEFSLEVRRGSIFGLIGPNGSGKTTTLKMISTLIKPDRGRLQVCGYDLDRGTAAPMAQWLRADLERTRAKWLIAFWHHPAYTKGSHDSDREGQLIEMRENFMPILEAAGVDAKEIAQNLISVLAQPRGTEGSR